MQKYKEYMSHIHAPEELIEKTISRVKDEESKVKENKVGAEIERIEETQVEIAVEAEEGIGSETEVKILAERELEVIAEKEVEIAAEIESECNNIEVSNIDEIEIKEYDEINYKKMGQSIRGNSPDENIIANTTTNLIKGSVAEGQITEESITQIGNNKIATNQTAGEIRSEENIIKFKKKKHKRFIFAGISAAAAAFIAVNISIYMNTVSYTNISLDMLRSQDVNAKYKKMSLEDYEKYLGINLSTLVSDNEESIENIEIKAVMDENSATPDLDEAVFYFSSNGESNIILRVSKTKTLAPEQLLKSKQSKIGKYRVCFGDNEEIGKLYAGGKMNGVNYFVIGSKIEKKDFEKSLKKYFDCMKPFVQ